MANLATTYLGLELRNPLIIGSSGLTQSLKDIKKFEEAGAGAIVLKSIFEEQIRGEAGEVISAGGEINNDNEAQDYIYYYTKQNTLDKYLKFIGEVKNEVSIPVIASINCTTLTEWPAFLHTVENAGADALEINVFIMPAEEKRTSEEIEQFYFNLANEVKKHTNLQFSLKISSYFSSLTHTLVKLSNTDVSGLVIFNRFFSPDIDTKLLKVKSTNIYSHPNEISLPLRWTGILSSKVGCHISATTGVHDGEGLIKLLLAGAQTVQIASVLYAKGPNIIKEILNTLQSWMDTHKFSSVDEFRGKCNQANINKPDMYERAQFMKYFSGDKN